MATPTENTFRKAGVEYHEERLAEFGGWDADATDATLGRADFSEVRNFRRPSTGDLEVRTGIIEHELASTSSATLLAKCEYRADYNGTDTFFDVSLYYQSGVGVTLALLEPISGWQKTVLVDAAATDAESWVMQYAYSLIVTVKGKATYEASPTNNTLATWTVTEIGKDLGPVPIVVTFVGKTQGDLFVIDNTGSQQASSFASHVIPDPNDVPNPSVIPLPIHADYWTVEDSYSTLSGDPFAGNQLPLMVFAKQDAASSAQNMGDHDSGHNMTRAWGYKLVAVQEFTNAKGEKYRVRSAPSPDFWVADIMYAPAQWYHHPQKQEGQGLVGLHFWLTVDQALDHTGSVDVASSDIHGMYPIGEIVTKLPYFQLQDGTAPQPVPSRTDLQTLQTKFRKWLKADQALPQVTDPYIWAAEYLGYYSSDSSGVGLQGRCPYLDHVPASKLKGAPMAVFSWSLIDKSMLQGAVTEIEIYRTAHSEPDDKDNLVKDPNFETHRYGYVGSILAPVGSEEPTFTDDTVDDAIDFGTTPEQQDGYLRGQFSGSVMRDYDNRLVIGDVVTDYNVLAPIAANVFDLPYRTTGAFYFRVLNDASPSYDYSDFAPTQKVRFGVAYVDNNGIQSDMTDLGPPDWAASTFGEPIAPHKFYVSINLPRGYAANVTTVRIFRGYLNASGGTDWSPTGANPTAGLIATMKVDSGAGNYLSKNDETAVAGSIVGETHRSTNPGAIIYSEPNQINFWPPLNFEMHHQFAPVRMLEVVLGPLYVGTDQSISLTELNGRREELTRRIGPISRHGWQKVDKIVFMLTPYGMYYIESSGVVQFPANVQTAILPYLTETIAGVLPLTNARRAAIGFLGERNEVHLHLPSSSLIGGALPHRTIVFKLGSGNNPRETVNYEFDLSPDFELGDAKTALGLLVADVTKYRPEQVLFQTRAMGGLFATYYKTASNELVTIDCDAPVPWTGSAALEKSWNLGASTVKKALREMMVRTSGSAKILLSTGQPMGLGIRSHKYGALHQRSRIFPVTNAKPPLRHIVSGATIETTATAPITRIWSEPDINGDHSLHVNAIELALVIINNHP